MTTNKNDVPYYTRRGLANPTELLMLALDTMKEEHTVSTLISALAVVRTVNSSDIELEFFLHIHKFLVDNVLGFTEDIE